jgi:FkbM family methyltransferase
MKTIVRFLLGNRGYTNLYKFKSNINPLIGYFKEKKRAKMRFHFYSTFINENDLCFDVGANYGNRVKTFIDLNARVVAIEPQKKCCEYLERKFGNKIVIINKGLGSKAEIKNFYEADISSLSTFSEEWIESVKQTRFKQHSWQSSKKIEITTLDRLIEEYGVPSFIKIDVEGYESEVLSGLNTPVKMLSFEYTVPEKLEKVITCIKKIESLNSHFQCNYSIQESMEFALKKWVSISEICGIINSTEFISTSVGDIYVKLPDKEVYKNQKQLYETPLSHY